MSAAQLRPARLWPAQSQGVLCYMMKLRKALVLASLVSMFAAPAAMAGVSLVGIGNLGMPAENLNGSSSYSFSSTLGFGGGVLFEAPMGQSAGLEIGGLYYQQKYTVDTSAFGLSPGTNASISYWVIEVPVALKIHLGHIFYIRAGGYLSNVVGSLTESVSGTDSSSNVSDVGENALNYGILGGLGLNIPMGATAALRLEGNYHLQLSNSYNSTVTGFSSANSFKYNEAQILAGVTFGMHSSR